MRIYLIGFMGCGKSTLARELASQLGLSFIDMDKFIEERYLKAIPQLFAEDGEPVFRLKERNCLQEIAGFQDVVVATGGGLPCFFENMKLMRETGISVFLDVDCRELFRRLRKSAQKRPLLENKTDEQLLAYIEQTMILRRPFYEQAAYIVSGNAIGVSDIIQKSGIS